MLVKTPLQKWFVLGLLGVFLAVSVQYSAKVLKPRKDGNTQSAVLRWTKQIQDMEDGENIHAKYNYPNLPIMAMILWPMSELATLSPLAGALTWFYLKVAMALLCMYWAIRLVEGDGPPFPVWAKALAILAALKPILGDLSHGNVNIFILFTVMSSLYAYSRGRGMLAGLLLGLAIACKVTPALLVVYFAWKRSWGALIGCAIGLVAFVLVVPSAVFGIQDGSIVAGWERNWESLVAWYRGMIVPYLVHGIVTPERENQSLPGLLTRLLSHAPAFSTWADDVQVPLAYCNLADLGSSSIKRVVQAFQFLFIVAMVWACRTPRTLDGRRGWQASAEYSFILVGMLLFSERTWKHHCVTLLLPMLTLMYIAALDARRYVRVAAWSAVVISALLMLSTSSGVFGNEMKDVKKTFEAIPVAVGVPAYAAVIEPAAASGATAELDLIPNSPGKFAQAYGAYVWAFFVMIAGLLLAMRRGQVAPAGATTA